MNLDSQKPIHKKRPPINVLNFIKEDILEVSINLIQHLKHVIQLVCSQASQTLIIKIYISILHTCISKRLQAKSRLSATTHTNNNLSLRTIQIHKVFFHSRTKILV